MSNLCIYLLRKYICGRYIVIGYFWALYFVAIRTVIDYTRKLDPTRPVTFVTNQDSTVDKAVRGEWLILSIGVRLFLFECLFPCLSVCLSVCLAVCLSDRASVCLSVFRSVFVFLRLVLARLKHCSCKIAFHISFKRKYKLHDYHF